MALRGEPGALMDACIHLATIETFTCNLTL